MAFSNLITVNTLKAWNSWHPIIIELYRNNAKAKIIAPYHFLLAAIETNNPVL
jgi:hypothetical protein